MPFHFRHFSLDDSNSTMRTGTDAMLLGALAVADRPRNILDIGTGCGVLSLMMAQKYDASVVAIEPDLRSYQEAAVNFARSPWCHRLTAIHTRLQDFSEKAEAAFDMLISNPPFFRNSLNCPDERRNLARHDSGLSLQELLSGVEVLMSESGCCWLILPFSLLEIFAEMAEKKELFLHRIINLKSAEHKSVKRVVFSLGRGNTEIHSSELCIRKAGGGFTDEYIRLTRDFHHHLPESQ